MGRPRQTTKSILHNVSLPEPLAAKLALELFSELEMKVPHGAYKEFFTNLVQEYFDRKEAQVECT